METQTSPLDATTSPTDRALVIRGLGPAMHIKTDKPSRMLIVTKSRAKSLTLTGHTNIKFAA